MSALKETALSIFQAGLDAVDPSASIIGKVSRSSNRLTIVDSSRTFTWDLSTYRSIRVVGCGKAASPMAGAVESILGETVESGIVVTKYGHGESRTLSKIRLLEAGHPEPDENGLRGAQETAGLLDSCNNDDLVIALISGGGSSLWPLPVPEITLGDKKEISRLLLGSGAAIDEMNIVRKHLSRIKGGFAARSAYPATTICLVLSDVVGDELKTIASGPFYPDSSTFRDAWNIITKYDLHSRIPRAVREYITRGMVSPELETPKTGAVCFDTVLHFFIGTNRLFLDAAAGKARRLGFEPIVEPEPVTGDVQGAAKQLCDRIKQRAQKYPSKSQCLISGGETTVKLGRSHGAGGRNQELALIAALALQGMGNVTFLSCGTDGTDGPTDATGAVVDGATIARCQAAGIDAGKVLREHDSYHALEKTGSLVKTGPTRTNVMDVQIALITPLIQ